ncbi:hypothetical protein FSU_2569 [Fibrobacter succinogenes subsp. succinogenes S85]|uniref:Sulfatase N-terminal domain-containing protein n=1 Tax=Fibrobacter succinogenes (strain ATCC 19169 / S85) TaxID=59374 RepID=C9RJB3_FIBSS|nr:hypothetical protein [Fibrobacter succinogenes]ACX75630.1 hypothetical protein Fisuc_2043 [Fibrobacter succinogenes subsp. succinogenes S85]ADL24927.1 hypothetical protein FSU_2569 [Fibrobacter succinogenes subsp. succinogenes S85]
MKKLLYPLIASALITIVPFLLTFEKGQDIVRGLFGFEYFAILLFIVFFKKIRWFLIPSIALLFIIAWIDLQNLLAIKNWSTGWYGLIPFVTCGLAIAMVWQIKPFKFNAICFILFVALILHLEANNRYAAQPLAQFPTIDYLERSAPKPIQRTKIANKFNDRFTVTDSVTITRDYIDTTRNNVIILVESWGVPLDIQRFEEQLKVFNNPTVVGIHNRMYSRTRTAEREDLIQSITRDSITRKRDTTFLPKVFNSIGYKTTFIFGSDSLEHLRYKYIKNIGFNEAIYGKDANNSILNDVQVISKIDSLLADTAQKHFIAWTTLDTKFPLLGFTSIYNSNPNAVDSAYTKLLTNTLTQIANLASKHPKTRFIIQGDHNPILSPIKFQERFYKRWVPFVILN